MKFREFKDYRKIVVAGGREFDNYDLLYSTLKPIITNDDIIVSGGAIGADQLGEKFAIANDVALTFFLPDYNKYGKKVAPLIRNEQMAKFSNYLIAFWDGLSTGTAHMIGMAKKHNLKIKILRYE